MIDFFFEKINYLFVLGISFFRKENEILDEVVNGNALN
jgi:hypothetical protein